MMWKLIFVLACVASLTVVSCDGCGGDPNAHSGCGVNCGRTCSTYQTKDVACILICNLNGCDCNDGYVFDPNVNKCVLPENCNETIPTEETISTAETKPTGATIPTGETESTVVTAGTNKRCGCHPQICGKYEEYYNCSGGCIPRRCSEIGFPLNCDKKCTPGCVCKGSYVRADNGMCIPIPDCPSCGGDKNAEQGCGNHCGRTCSDYNKPPTRCPIGCIFNGCNCRKGFVYDNNIKACVKPEDCTPVCQANEEYSSCTNGGCDARNCSQVGKPVPCVKLDPRFCIKGCVCVKGYLRASDGTCVPKDQCAPKCHKPNEVYDECPAPCPPKRCNVNEAVIKCAAPPKPGDPDCEPGCRCADTYYRNATGTCVPKKKCEKPLTCGRPNEVYDACPPICPTRECGVNPAVLRCMRPPEYGDPNCRPSCVCIDGYVRNAAKECIPMDECPLRCPANEEYSPCTNGGCDARNCSQVGKPVPCVKLDPKSCIKGCVCVKGWLRDSNGTCVPKDQCTSRCGKHNEVYDECPAPCPPRRCNVDEAVIKCAAPPKPGDPDCKPGCRCADTYYRNATGTCVPKKKCEKPLTCGRPNEVYDACPPICPTRECGVNPAVMLCMRPPEYGDPNCRPSCVCIDGYVRNAAKECIPMDECPLRCPANEEYSPCTNGGCDARNCSQVGKPVPCVKLDPKSCIKGCVCVKGWLRDSNGTCVPKDQCTSKCDKPNEVYDECPAPCPPRRCNVDEAVIKCAAPPKPGDPDCNPGCRCADTYYRNATGTCVPKNKCEKPLTCGRPNEVYDACPPICPTRECGVNPAVLLCMRPPEYGDPNCRPSCVCIDGYVRNAAKECIPVDECPLSCPANEEYSPCTNGGCVARNCSQVGKPVPCVKLDPKSCIKGCVCVKGWLRDLNGTCVPKDQCTSRCDKPNEVYDECPAPCPPKWCNVNEAVIKCAAPPKPGDPDCKPGCRCADTYYRNATGTCVPKNKCEKPLTCDRSNEVYDACPSICPTRECGVHGSKMRCMRPPEYGDPNCSPSCVCINGYARNAAKECIPWDQCPKPCGQNEYWEKCIVGCTNQSCADLSRPAMSCPAEIEGQCKSGCRCKPKYYRNSNGICVPESECPRCNGLNEYWEKCIQGCSNQSCDDIGQIFHCPNQPAGQCKSGCRCIPGTWRNASKICVPQEKCPKPDCPSGEVWSWCPTVKCDGDYCPKTRDSPQTCPVGIVCDKPRCVCESNRKRDWINGKCIPIKDCPSFKCKCNEEYQVCPSPCPGENCSVYINGPPRCPPYKFVCRPQCRCIKHYYRDAVGTCIPACHCPKETPTTTTAEPPTSTVGSGTGLTGIVDGITVFTGICLYNRMQSAPSENIIMSAMSVFTPIAELCLWSEGAAYDQCMKILNLKDKQDIRDTFPKFTATYEGQTSVNFSTAGKIYSDENHKISNGFNEDVRKVFKAETEELDFSKNKEAAATMNAWVESQTNNRIKDLVTPDMLSPSTRLVLINAIYFKGLWQYEFNKNNTKEEEFYLNDGTTKQSKMMYQEIKALDYAEIPSLDCQAVRMFYKGKTSSMIIVLPNTKNGTMDLAKKLQDPANWKKITDGFSPEKVQLYIPQFKITTTTDLKDLMKKANIVDWFNCQNSGIKGILEIPDDVCITEAVQKAFIEVNEDGAEAAAANAVVVSTRSLPFPPPVLKEFKANRAFLYYLRVGSIVALCGAFNG